MKRDFQVGLMVAVLTSSVWMLVVSRIMDRQTAELTALTARVREAERLAEQAQATPPPENDPFGDLLRPVCDLFLQFTVDDHRTVVQWLDDLDENTRNQELQLAEGSIPYNDAGGLIRANFDSFLPSIRFFAELGVEHGVQTQDCFAGIMPDIPQYVPGEHASLP